VDLVGIRFGLTLLGYRDQDEAVAIQIHNDWTWI